MEREDSNRSEKHNNVVSDQNQTSYENSTIQEVVRLFDEKDEPLFQISAKIREKVIDREEVTSSMKDLKFKIKRRNESVDYKKEFLHTELYRALENLSLPKSFSNNQKNHKLNLRMLHKTKNLAREKQLLREINVNQQNASTSPLEEISKILLRMQWKHKHCYQYRNIQKISEKLLQEIKQFEVTRKISEGLRKAIINQIKIICDDLMEMRKKKKALETKIKQLEEKLEAINEGLWSFQKHLKEKHHRKEASLFLLGETKSIAYDYWFLRHWNMEHGTWNLIL